MGTKWEQCASVSCTNERIEPAALCNSCLSEVYGQLKKPGQLVQPVGTLEDQELPPEPTASAPASSRKLSAKEQADLVIGGGHTQYGGAYSQRAPCGPSRSHGYPVPLSAPRPLTPVPTLFMLAPGQCDRLRCGPGDAEVLEIKKLRINTPKPILLCGAEIQHTPQLLFSNYGDHGVGVRTDTYDVPGGIEVDFRPVGYLPHQSLTLHLKNDLDRKICGIVELWGIPHNDYDFQRSRP